jgi:hypothetical protein
MVGLSFSLFKAHLQQFYEDRKTAMQTQHKGQNKVNGFFPLSRKANLFNSTCCFNHSMGKKYIYQLATAVHKPFKSALPISSWTQLSNPKD